MELMVRDHQYNAENLNKDIIELLQLFAYLRCNKV